MCPPTKCCCFELELGLKIFGGLQIAMLSFYIVMSATDTRQQQFTAHICVSQSESRTITARLSLVRLLATHPAPVLWRSVRVAHCGRLRLRPSDG